MCLWLHGKYPHKYIHSEKYNVLSAREPVYGRPNLCWKWQFKSIRFAQLWYLAFRNVLFFFRNVDAIYRKRAVYTQIYPFSITLNTQCACADVSCLCVCVCERAYNKSVTMNLFDRIRIRIRFYHSFWLGVSRYVCINMARQSGDGGSGSGSTALFPFTLPFFTYIETTTQNDAINIPIK